MRKICLVTTTRAEYGIMSRLIQNLYLDRDIDFSLVVTGMHLSDKFGKTIEEINVPINQTIDIDIEANPSHSIAIAIEKFSQYFKDNSFDIVVLLGDRCEVLGIAIAAMLNKIPIAHLYGGETTQGAIDEAIRHSITKMSHLHFTSCESYKNRVIQLGENPQRVFNVGALGVENIKFLKLLEKNELENSLNFKFTQRNLLLTFHPVTLEGNVGKQFSELLNALDKQQNTNIIITGANCDEGYEEIFDLINKFVQTHQNAKAYNSLGVVRYLSCMKYVDAVIGNSSSGILEVPSFKIPTINIGNRQKGRIQAKSIINCEPKKESIINAINNAYKLDCSTVKNPYEGYDTLNQIVNILKTYDLSNILKKEFYDIKNIF